MGECTGEEVADALRPNLSAGLRSKYACEDPSLRLLPGRQCQHFCGAAASTLSGHLCHKRKDNAKRIVRDVRCSVILSQRAALHYTAKFVAESLKCPAGACTSFDSWQCVNSVSAD